jgi:hypothetical protein
MQISALLQVIDLNEPVIKRQRSRVLWACRLLPAIVVILLALSLVPR